MHAALEPGLSSAPNLPAGRGRWRLLVVEDEVGTATYLADRLAERGWDVELAFDGELAFRRTLEGAFDAILMDRMLPTRDGLALVKDLRTRGDKTPVIFTSAMGAEADRIAGFEGGGDDYLVKPFSFEELDARLRALIRRHRNGSAEQVTLHVDDLEINRIERSVHRAGVEIDLMPLEYKLLEFLLMRAGEVVTRSMLLEGVWGFKFDPRTNIVETHISRLRAKITAPGAKPIIQTRRGAGYVIGAL